DVAAVRFGIDGCLATKVAEAMSIIRACLDGRLAAAPVHNHRADAPPGSVSCRCRLPDRLSVGVQRGVLGTDVPGSLPARRAPGEHHHAGDGRSAAYWHVARSGAVHARDAVDVDRIPQGSG